MISDLPEHVQVLLKELEQFGKEHDANEQDHERKMRNLETPAAEFVFILIRASRAKRVLEIGTSNGYSTVWLASAVQPLEGRVTTLDNSTRKADMARQNFERAKLQSSINFHLTDAGEFLKRTPPASFDFVFLDTDRELFVPWWPELQRVLAPGGLLVADNAISHAADMAPFKQLVEKAPGFNTAVVSVGKGEFIVLKEF